jgi:hypothetical protein
MTMHQKTNVLIFTCAKWAISEEQISNLSILLFFSLSIFSSPKRNPSKNHYSNTSPPWTLVLFLSTIAEPNIFLQICTHTQTNTINIDLCPPIARHMPTHGIQIAPMYSKSV